MTSRLTHVRVAGFRSLGEVQVDLGPVTVLVGANGAGKSNLLGALTMARMLAFESLQLFVSRAGGATFLLHYGPRTTPALELVFATERGWNAYEARLEYGSDESLVFADERAGFRREHEQPWEWQALGAGHRESRLKEAAESHVTPRTVSWLLRGLNFFHFHDTSRTSALRTLATIDDDRFLRSDGSNLAAFLLSLRDSPKESSKAAWSRIQGLVRRVAPLVREIQPVAAGAHGVRLDWADDRGETLGPSHLSDGTLRAIALLTALGQPGETLPMVSCIDEPELGLHPAALKVLCELIKSAAAEHQVIVSTQSPALLDGLAPHEVIVAERKDGATELRRLDPQALDVWRDDYSLSEKPRCDVLLFVTTKTEREVLRKVVPGAREVAGKYSAYLDLGQIHPQYRVFAVETEMGALQRGGSATKALLCPVETGARYIIAVGTAFGIDRDTQKFGDVLVASHVLPYDSVVVDTDSDGRLPRIRYDKVGVTPTNPTLVSLLHRHIDGSGLLFKVHFGAMLSGGAQIQCRVYRDHLAAKLDKKLTDLDKQEQKRGKTLSERVIGGEMEGAGLVAAPPAGGQTPWLIVKGISDFADEAHGEDNPQRRREACENALRLVLGALAGAPLPEDATPAQAGES